MNTLLCESKNHVKIQIMSTGLILCTEFHCDAQMSLDMLRINDLRMGGGPKTEVFFAKVRIVGKSRSQQHLLGTKKKNVGSHAFFRDN